MGKLLMTRCVVLVAALLLGAGTSHAALAVSGDHTAALLAKVRVSYEIRMERIRKDVLAIITSNAAKVNRQDKGDGAKAQAVDEEQHAFRTRGGWPRGAAVAELQAHAASAAKEMREAYATAVASYEKADKKELRDAVDLEATCFETHNDMVPWSADFVKGDADETVKLNRGSSRDFSIPVSGEYRLDVQAARTTGEGPLVIETGLPDSKRVALSAAPEPNGTLRVLLTVRKGVIAADLGVTRPV